MYGLQGILRGDIQKDSCAAGRHAFLSFQRPTFSRICFWERDLFSHTFHLCFIEKGETISEKNPLSDLLFALSGFKKIMENSHFLRSITANIL